MARGHQILTEEILGKVEGGLPKAPTISPIQSSSLAAEAPPLIEESFHGSLEDAANLLLSLLLPSIRDYAIELADITLKIPRWQLILGSLMAQHESGTLTAPSIDPAWRQVELLIEKSICQYSLCKKQFSPKRFGQKYCSNLCGDMVRKEEIKKQNEMRDKMREAEKEAEKEAGLIL